MNFEYIENFNPNLVNLQRCPNLVKCQGGMPRFGQHKARNHALPLTYIHCQ